jgi:hypothetical protein
VLGFNLVIKNAYDLGQAYMLGASSYEENEI